MQKSKDVIRQVTGAVGFFYACTFLVGSIFFGFDVSAFGTAICFFLLSIAALTSGKSGRGARSNSLLLIAIACATLLYIPILAVSIRELIMELHRVPTMENLVANALGIVFQSLPVVLLAGFAWLFYRGQSA